MSAAKIAILDVQETIFFSHYDGRLCQWIQARISSAHAGVVQAQAVLSAAGSEVRIPLEIKPGIHEYRCYAPALWPKHPPLEDASLVVESAGEQASAAAPVGHHRPWVVYLLADVCTDDTWVYGDYDAMRKDDADLTAVELALAEATREGDPVNHNHYNLVHALCLEYFAEFYPEQVDRLAEAIRRGEITLNPFYNMTLTQNLSLEEQIRHFYAAREWAVKYGLPLAYANHQETPTIAWDMPGVLAGSGVRHLIKAILPYECSWAERLEEPPLFQWEGVDGTRILLRRRNWDYVEGAFVLKGLEETRKALHEKVLPEYEQMGGRYPFNAISLLGCYGDLIPFKPGKPQSKDLPPLKAATIAAYNAQGWEYPRLVNAAHQQFWEDIEEQIAQRGIELPVSRGDFGTGWDAWPACLAYDVAGWRRAQERAGAADKLAAVLSVLRPDWYAQNRELLKEGWRCLCLLGDHAWNGANDENRTLNARLRREWQTNANRSFDEVIAAGMKTLAGLVPTGSAPRLLVFNSLPWQRGGAVQVRGIDPGWQVLDVESGKAVPTQAEESGLAFIAQDVPPVGYRVYECRPNQPQAELPWRLEANRLEGPFYRLEVSPLTGGITSLYDKVRGKELVDANSPYHLNQCLYYSGLPVDPHRPYPLLAAPHIEEAVEYRSEAVEIEPGPCGPVSASLVVRARLKNHVVTTTITLYATLDRVDIRNEVEKTPSTEKHELDFAFPFNIPGREIRCETPAAILNPGADHLPGAGLGFAAVRHFVDLFNAEYGVTLAQADTFVTEFGHRTTAEDMLRLDDSNSTVLVLALDNIFDGNEAVRDQAGERRFVFRFGLRGHAGGFDPAAAIRFGWEDNNELLCAPIPVKQGEASAALLPSSYSFASVEPESAVLTCLKPAEEDGLIARVWECAGSSSTARVRLAEALAPKAARLTDHLERDLSALELSSGEAAAPVKPRGVSTLRFIV